MTDWQKQVIVAPGAPATRGPSSAHAVRVGPLLFVTGQSGRQPGSDSYLTDPHEHARQTMENVKAIVEAAGGSMAGIVKRTIIVRDLDVFAEAMPVIEDYFPSPVASTTLRGGLMLDGMLLEVEVIAVLPTDTPA